VLNISSGLTELRSNFIKGITLYKEEAERLALVLGERLEYLLQAAVSEPCIYRILRLASLRPGIRKLAGRVFEVKPCVSSERSNTGVERWPDGRPFGESRTARSLWNC
jgi:hypothetical protein